MLLCCRHASEGWHPASGHQSWTPAFAGVTTLRGPRGGGDATEVYS